MAAGEAGADGVVNGVAFSADGMTLNITTSNGGMFAASVPDALRQAGLSQAQVQALINAAEADDLDAGAVAVQIATALTNYRQIASVFSRSANYALQVSDRGDTIRATGNAALTFTAPGVVPNGWWARLLNTSDAVLTFDVGITARVEGAGQTLEIPAGDCVTVQYLGSSTWGVVTDTAGEAATGGEAASAAPTMIAGPLTFPNTTNWHNLDLDEDIEANQEYAAVIQRGAASDGTASLSISESFWGSDLLGLNVNPGGAYSLNAEPSQLGLVVGRTDAVGAFALHLAKTDDARVLLAHIHNDTYRLTRLVRLPSRGGGSGGVPDGSLTAAKMDVSDAAKQAAFRKAFQSAHISVRDTIPPIADANIGSDVVILSAGIADGISIVDITDPSVEITAAEVGDVLMALMFREAVWTRVGNIITGRGDATARAAVAALMLRVLANEQLTSDIDRIVDSVSWANAPAAEAQFAAIPAASALGRKITRVDPTAIDPAVDIPAATQWHTVLNPVPADSAMLIRVKAGLAPIQFRLNNNGSVESLFSFRSPVSDANWDYYQGGVTSGGASGIEKRTEAFHTAWHGDLAGRALAPITALQERATALESQAWPGTVAVAPHELYPSIGAFTMRATLTRTTGTFPNGARMRIAAGARNGAFVHATEDKAAPATLAFDAAQSRALIQNTSNGWIGGTLYLDVYESDEATRIVRIPLYIPVVQGSVGPLITNIAAYDAAQDRFEDSTGGQVTLHPGSIVLTTQAIYDAAVADSFAFPADVIFLTR